MGDIIGDVKLGPAVLSNTPPFVERPDQILFPTVISRTIQHRLMTQSQHQAVLSLAQDYLPHFAFVNLICAMCQLGAQVRDQDDLLRGIRGDAAFVVLFAEVKKQALEQAAKLDERSIANLIWACSRLRIFDGELYGKLLDEAGKRLHMFSGIGMQKLVFAIGFAAHQPKASFMQALHREVRARAGSDMTLRDLVVIVYAMHRLGIKDDRLMQVIMEHLLREEFKDRGTESPDLPCLCLALARLEYFDECLFRKLGEFLLRNLNKQSPTSVMMFMIGLAQAVENVPEVLQHFMEAERQIIVNFGRFEPSIFVGLCHAIGKSRQLVQDPREASQARFTIAARQPQADSPGDRIVQEARRRSLDTFLGTEVVLLLQALKRLQHRDTSFLSEISDFLIWSAPELHETEICTSVYCMGQLQFLHLRFVDTMIAEVRRRRPKLQCMGLQDLSVLMFGLAWLRLKDESLMKEAAEVLCERIREMPPRQLLMMCRALSILDCRTHGLAVSSVVAEHVVDNLKDFTPHEVATILQNLVLLSGPSCGIHILHLLLLEDFWLTDDCDEMTFTQLFTVLSCLESEAGIAVKEFSIYLFSLHATDNSNLEKSEQIAHFSSGLHVASIQHKACEAPETLPGHRPCGLRADITIPSMRLAVEVQGPMTMLISMNALREEMADETYNQMGNPAQVLHETQALVGEVYAGYSSFKHRLLRRCGWKVVQVTFLQNDDLLLSAIKRKSAEQKQKDLEQESEDAGPSEPPSPEDAGGSEDETEASSKYPNGYESAVRERVAEGRQELQRRIVEERGNAADSGRFASHLEYRAWQARLERQVFREVLSKL